MAIVQNSYVPCGNVDELKKHFNLDDESILEELKKLCA
jgi:transketolase C-terminal domain/subunit